MWFLVFIFISFIAFGVVYILNFRFLRSEHKLESMISRESSFLFNNLLFVTACFTVFWGTFFPKISEWLQGNKVTVGAPFYNNVAVPIALLLLLLTAVGPWLAWRRTSFESLKRSFKWPAAGALSIGLLMIILGVRPWNDIAYFYSLMAAMLAALVIFTVISEFVRGGQVIQRHTGFSLLGSMLHLYHRNTRRYGGYIVHYGVAIVIIGILGTPFNRDAEKEMGFGDKINIGPYTLVCQSYTQDDNPNFSNEWAIINVFKGNEQLTTMYPERRLYKASSQPQTIPRIWETWYQDLFLVKDLYIVYEGRNEDTGRPIIKAHLNPMVPWIWIGLVIMVFGTITCLVPNATPVRATVPARVQTAPAVGAGD
jgi:cytochrome c-type biogenesis protein CcmF